MAEATRPLRLVPPPTDGEGTISRAFSCRGPHDIRAALEAVAASGGRPVPLIDVETWSETWLDTADARIVRAGLVLRIEDGGPDPVAWLTPAAKAGERGADESSFVQPLPPGPLAETVRAPGPVGDRVRAVAGTKPLEARRGTMVRHLFQEAPGSLRVEVVASDAHGAARVTIAGEPEAIDALVASLQAFVELGPARPIVELPAESDLGPAEVAPDVSAAGLAYVSLRRNARAFLRHEPGTRLGDDPEALHDMRVAGRRMRAAFGLFAPYLPKRADSLRRELGRLGRSLGAVRDLDVQLEQLAQWRGEAAAADAEALDAIERVLVHRREVARRKMLATLDAARYERFIGRLSAFLRHGPGRRPADGRRPARQAALALVGRRYRALRKLGDRLTPASLPGDFHVARIRAKRLRYALEFHAPLYDGDVKAMIESLTALQDLLGEHQDAHVAVAHLEELARGGRRKLPRRALFLMGTIAARYEQRARMLRAAFPKTYKTIRGRRWKALKATLSTGWSS